MSHYTVMVCLPADTKDVETALSEALAPYDENIEVEPYRRYEEGSAEDHWSARSLRTDLDLFRRIEAEGIDPVRRELVAQFEAEASSWDRRSPAEKADQEISDAHWAGERAALVAESPLTWATLAALNNERWQYAERDEDGELDSSFEHVDDDGRAYTWSRYNPDSKWDYWRIGGRWSGYFAAREMSPELIQPESHWDGPRVGALGRLACDGGPKRLLDFEAMRDKAGAEANERYDKYEELYAEHGPGKPWSHFTGLVDATEMSIEEARRLYHEQPIIEAHRKLDRADQGLTGWGDCLIETFTPPREEYVRLKRDGAVPAYATLTLSGEWAAPGRMGWFGMSSDGAGEREAYNAAINRYLDELKPDALLVVVDCHI